MQHGFLNYEPGIVYLHINVCIFYTAKSLQLRRIYKKGTHENYKERNGNHPSSISCTNNKDKRGTFITPKYEIKSHKPAGKRRRLERDNASASKET